MQQCAANQMGIRNLESIECRLKAIKIVVLWIGTLQVVVDQNPVGSYSGGGMPFLKYSRLKFRF